MNAFIDLFEWSDFAACRELEPELFFPVSEVGPGARQVAQAKAVCETCPVKQNCLEFALTEGLNSGIFGGTAESERRELRARSLSV